MLTLASPASTTTDIGGPDMLKNLTEQWPQDYLRDPKEHAPCMRHHPGTSLPRSVPKLTIDQCFSACTIRERYQNPARVSTDKREMRVEISRIGTSARLHQFNIRLWEDAKARFM